MNNFSVAIEDSSGNVVPNYNSAVTLTLNTGIFSNGTNTVTVNVVNGVATFNALVIDAAGTYTITVTATSGAITHSTQVTLIVM